MPTVSFDKLWNNHPFPMYPCDKKEFKNQCAIRMGIALEASDVDTSSFDVMYPNRRCYPGLKHSPRHILAAQELAHWMKRKIIVFGKGEIHKNVTHSDFRGRKGIVFVKNGWGATDDIDVWNGITMKGGEVSYFRLGKEIWFWELR